MTQAATPTPRRRSAQGQQTRETILKTAVDVASVEGLEGLSIGRLAAELGMSKSGLFAHFGSKEDLQLAVIDRALEIYTAEVIEPAMAARPGMARLEALMTAWLSYGERKVFRGGCFFAAVAVEFDSRPGVVRDRIAELMRQWLGIVGQIVREAQKLGDVDPGIDPAQLAFELHTLLWGANGLLQLLDGEEVAARTKTAVAQRLQQVRCPSPE